MVKAHRDASYGESEISQWISSPLEAWNIFIEKTTHSRQDLMTSFLLYISFHHPSHHPSTSKTRSRILRCVSKLPKI